MDINLTEDEKNSIKDMPDSRNISDELMGAFIKEDGVFKSFWDFVKEHDDLAVCFRGNSEPESIIIYHFNHVVWELYITKHPPKNRVNINLDHARYLENYEKKCQEHFENFEKSQDPSFNSNKKKISINEKTAKLGTLTYKTKSSYSKDFVEKTYHWIVEEMMDSYFNSNMDTDYFRKTLDMPQPDRNRYPKKLYVEKRWQQSLFKKFQNVNDPSLFKMFQNVNDPSLFKMFQNDNKQSLFIYDLEFSQRFPDRNIRNKFKDLINEPDMLGVLYNENGTIVSLVLIEVKSTETACTGSSGIETHLKKMRIYSDEVFDEELSFPIFIQNRKKDMPEILKRYKELNILPEVIQIPQKSCDDILVKRLLIFTNCVVPESEKNAQSAIDYFNRHKGKIEKCAKKNHCDIWLVTGNYYDSNFIIEYYPPYND